MTKLVYAVVIVGAFLLGAYATSCFTPSVDHMRAGGVAAACLVLAGVLSVFPESFL